MRSGSIPPLDPDIVCVLSVLSVLLVCVLGVLSVLSLCVFVFRPTAFAGGRKNVITQPVLVRSGCPLDTRQL